MGIPALFAGIEQGDHFTRLGVAGRHRVAFIAITLLAGKPEVSFYRLALQGFGDEVVNLHQRANDILLREAVATAILRLLSHSLAQLLGDMGFAHAGWSSPAMLCPRPFSRAIACARSSMARSYCRIKSARWPRSSAVSPSRCCL